MVESNVLINKSLFLKRFFGWFLITSLIIFMFNNVLNLSFDIPFAINFFSKGNIWSLIPLLGYVVAFFVSFYISLKF